MEEECKWESEEAARAGLHTDTQEPGAQAGHIEHELKEGPGEHGQGACGVSAGTVLHTDTQETGAQAGHLEHEVMEEPEIVAGTQVGPIEYEVIEELGCGVIAWAGLHTDTQEPGAQASHIEHEVKEEPGEHEQGECCVSAGTVLHTDTQETGAQAGHMGHEIMEQSESIAATQAGPIEYEVVEELGCGVSAWAALHTDTQEPVAQAGHIEHEVKLESREHEQGACGVSVWAGLDTDAQEPQAGHIKHVVKVELVEHEEGACWLSEWAGLHTGTQEAGVQAGHIEHEEMEEPESVASTQAGPIEHEVIEEFGEHEQGCGVTAWAGLHTDAQEPRAQVGHIEHEVKLEPRDHEQEARGVSVWAGLHTDTQELGVLAGHIEHEVKVEPVEHEQGAYGVSVWAELHTDTQEPGALAGHIEHEVKVEPVEHEQGVCGVSAWARLHTDTQEPGVLAGHIEHEVKVEPVEHEQGACGVSAWARLHKDTQEAGAQAGHIELAALYQDHKVKEELVVGPKKLHWPKVLLMHPASLSTAERSAVADSACSVRLEHMRVDLNRRACRVGSHTYKLRSSLNSQRDSYTRKKTNISKNTRRRQQENRRKDREKKSSIGQVSAPPFIQYSPHHTLCSSKSSATPAGVNSEDEEVDVVSLGTSQLPLATSHVLTESLPRVLSAQGRRHTQRTVTAATRPCPASCRCADPPAAGAAAGPRCHGRRSSTDRPRHSAMERLRRFGLRKLFDKLQKQIPATCRNIRAPKIVILREAISLCRRLREEDIERESLRKQQKKLLTKLKKLRTIVASIWF